jgi:hypothetical protein
MPAAGDAGNGFGAGDQALRKRFGLADAIG